MKNKKATKVHCLECQADCFVDTWKPPAGIDTRMRRFICSRGRHVFYKIVSDPELRKAYDRQLSR